MKILDFFEKVEQHPSLEGVAIDSEYLWVRERYSKIMTKVSFDIIPEKDWDWFEKVLTVQQEAQPVQYMTRVIGYFSLTRNWNASKLREREDRSKGNYNVE